MKNRIREVREGLGMNQAQLGDLLGINQGSVSRIENARGGIKLETLERVAEALGVPVQTLYLSSDVEERLDALTSRFLRIAPEQQEMVLKLLESLEGK